jgi:hypothetical protein
VLDGIMCQEWFAWSHDVPDFKQICICNHAEKSSAPTGCGQWVLERIKQWLRRE